MTAYGKTAAYYRIEYYSGGASNPKIELFSSLNYEEEYDEVMAGRLIFHKNRGPLPNNEIVHDTIILHFRLNQFNDIVELIRKEKPIGIQFQSNTGVGFLVTPGMEPIGEEGEKD